MVPNEKKKQLNCRVCGTKEKISRNVVLKEKVAPKERIEVVEETSIKTLPKVDEECPKCKHEGAYFWTVQTRASDEPETRFFECVKCHHRWRKYD